MAVQKPKQSSREDMSYNKKNAIPDRWTEYKAVGKRIPGTRFIAFKVPLKQSFRYQLTQSEVFGPFDLVRILEKEGQQLGLIIDLTFTTHYYKVEDLPNTLYHLKIFTAGHEVPNDATILSFKKAVRRFLHDNENNDKLIGVHCTHGLNRTGYLICRYLIDVDGMNPQKAINLFNESRGYSIERQNYLDDLRTGPKRSNEGMEEPDKEPVQGLAHEPRDDAPHHRREQHSHYPPFNGQGLHQWHREPQNQFLPFHQKNNMSWFEPPERQFFRPPLIPHPPHAVRPCFPNQSIRGFHFGRYPTPRPSDRFGQPYHNPHVPPEGSTGPPGPDRKLRHRHRKGPKDWTPR
ncbi:RNA/RNP complex-1-interacting phosphatase [Carassius auratus]|uniref:RNA/RNP complex-1-interacting phosphatase n=1 Tax=Carassius auratus TaxID=7957 RepID=A0A6P6KUQ1_CARAU|nr:RNA/RNP complex-1-interacting phosphatase-like [Carassius auratus]